MSLSTLSFPLSFEAAAQLLLTAGIAPSAAPWGHYMQLLADCNSTEDVIDAMDDIQTDIDETNALYEGIVDFGMLANPCYMSDYTLRDLAWTVDRDLRLGAALTIKALRGMDIEAAAIIEAIQQREVEEPQKYAENPIPRPRRACIEYVEKFFADRKTPENANV